MEMEMTSVIHGFAYGVNISFHNIVHVHMLYSELEDQQVAPPTQSYLWRQTKYFVFTNAFSLSFLCWRPFSFRPDKYNSMSTV